MARRLWKEPDPIHQLILKQPKVGEEAASEWLLCEKANVAERSSSACRGAQQQSFDRDQVRGVDQAAGQVHKAAIDCADPRMAASSRSSRSTVGPDRPHSILSCPSPGDHVKVISRPEIRGPSRPATPLVERTARGSINGGEAWAGPVRWSGAANLAARHPIQKPLQAPLRIVNNLQPRPSSNNSVAFVALLCRESQLIWRRAPTRRAEFITLPLITRQGLSGARATALPWRRHS
ncbi:MAG: hypothetical protein RI988_3038 [Pseudomonadota bacterium]|jgi:hypothetical protein